MDTSTTGTIQEATGQDTPTSVTDTPAVTQGGEKTFTQAQIDDIIKARLGKYSDYAELKEYRETAEAEKLTQVEKLNKQIESLSPFKDQADKQSQVIDSLLEQELEAVPEHMRGLIPESFDNLSKLDYIRKNADVFKTGPKPNLPAEADPTQPATPGLYAGKYTSLEEYAQNDPKGYTEWRKGGGGAEQLNF